MNVEQLNARILKEAANLVGLRTDEISGRGRQAWTAFGRQLWFWGLAQFFPVVHVARMTGRDHGTITHAVRRVEFTTQTQTRIYAALALDMQARVRQIEKEMELEENFPVRCRSNGSLAASF